MIRWLLVSLALTLVPAGVQAQILLSPDEPTLAPSASWTNPAPAGAASASWFTTAAAQTPPDRPCEGCPPRRIGRSLFQATFINIFYVLGNLARGEETAKVTPGTWWGNMKSGWEWDLNDFTTNQFGHPYQGNNYYTAGRANGLSYWESSALAAFGSATWEFFGETNDPSLNDFVNTTMGGIALGEMFYRTAWLIRNTHATGKGRMWREIAATAVDPVTGVNRFIYGDASRVMEKPAEVVPSSLGTVGTFGVMWHGGEDGGFENAQVSPTAEIDLLYGDAAVGAAEKPFDAFAVRLAFGGGRFVSEARVRGRLYSQGDDEGPKMVVLQGFHYNNNDAYQFGAQTVDLATSFTGNVSSKVTMALVASGGVTVLGATNSVPLVPVAPVVETNSEEEPTSRDYDYGPGSNARALLAFARGPHPFLEASWELHHIHVIDGIRANHLLQRVRMDLIVPLRGRLGIGVTGDYFFRKTFYQGGETSSTKFPQIRTFLSWSVP